MFLFEQNVDPRMFDQQQQQNVDNGDQATSQDLIPIKKFVIIQRLQDLRSKLSRYSITDTDLDVVLRFADLLSYDTLYNLSLVLIDKLDQKIKNTD